MFEPMDFEGIVSFVRYLPDVLTADQLLALEGVVIVLGDRGVGKTSIINELFHRDEQRGQEGGIRRYHRIPEAMTRHARKNEVEGRDMIHLPAGDFDRCVKEDQALSIEARKLGYLPRTPHFLTAFWVWQEGSSLRKRAGILWQTFVDALNLTITERRLNILITAACVAVDLKATFDLIRMVAITTEPESHRGFLAQRGDDPASASGKRLGPGDDGFKFLGEITIVNRSGAIDESIATLERAIDFAPLVGQRGRIAKLAQLRNSRGGG